MLHSAQTSCKVLLPVCMCTRSRPDRHLVLGVQFFLRHAYRESETVKVTELEVFFAASLSLQAFGTEAQSFCSRSNSGSL